MRVRHRDRASRKPIEDERLHLHDDFSFCLVIDPCYEKSTHVAIVDLWPDVRPFCYFHEYAKAWHFSFGSLKDIAQEVLRAEKIIISTFLRVKDSAAHRAATEESR